MSAPRIGEALAAEALLHQVRVFGLRPGPDLVLRILWRPGAERASEAREAAAAGALVVALRPGPAFCTAFGLVPAPAPAGPPAVLRYAASDAAWSRLRTLHPYDTYRGTDATGIVVDGSGQAAWVWAPTGRAGVLLVGTELVGDLLRYRQGDPAAAEARSTETLWDIPGERPVYLYENQLEPDRPRERHADNWAMALADALARRVGTGLHPILPGGAPGALVVTGDDDQAYLERYAEQRSLLRGLPTTYFLHPLTRHRRDTLRALMREPGVEVGIHPDAIAAPERYADLLREQVAWFRALTGNSPRSVRNHGYLNDGYWGHLPAWLEEGIELSVNVPGVDGRVLTGSLLPARVAADDVLTPHWSLVTLVGDGLVDAVGLGEREAAAALTASADAIRASGIPGVLVVNLHPQNVDRTAALHRAATEIGDGGFLAWSLASCLDWFRSVDGSGQPPGRRPRLPALGRLARSVGR